MDMHFYEGNQRRTGGTCARRDPAARAANHGDPAPPRQPTQWFLEGVWMLAAHVAVGERWGFCLIGSDGERMQLADELGVHT